MEGDFETMLHKWATSPTEASLIPSEDGVESGHDFLGFSLEQYLAPSPRQPAANAAAAQPLLHTDGTTGVAPQTSVPPAATAASSGFGPLLGHQQQQQQQQQQPQPQQLQGPAAMSHHGMPAYTPLMPMEHSAASHPLMQPQPVMVQLSANGNGHHHMAQHGPPQPSVCHQHGVYHQQGVSQPMVLPTMAAAPASSSQQQPSETNADGKRRRGPRPRVFKKHNCQSDGCTVDLAPLSFYLQRNHICPDHLKADSYLVKGVSSRFCQRCGQGHPLTEFEGSKRSCRKALERHNQRRRDKQAASAMNGPSAAREGSGIAAAGRPESVELQQQQEHSMQAPGVMAAGGWLDDTFAAMQGQSLSHPQQLHQPLDFHLNNQLPGEQQVEVLPPQQPMQAGMQAAPASSPYQPQLAQQPWVMLPRQLIEQHAPHLLSMAVPTAPPATWQPQQQPPSPQRLKQLDAPQQQLLSVDDPSFNLWNGEFGGSGI